MAFCVATSSSEAAYSSPSARITSASERVEARSPVVVGSAIGIGAGVVVSVVLDGIGIAVLGLLVVVALEERIVGLQVMGFHIEVVGVSVAGDDGLGRLAEPAGKPALIDEGAHVTGAEGARGE